jgi:hypothetical protein
MASLVDRARTTRRVAAEVLANPVLRRVELAFLAFNAVEYGSWVAILLYAYAATGPASVGSSRSSSSCRRRSSPFGSTLGDRFRREHVLLVAYGAFATLTAIIAAGMLGGWPAPTVYLAAILAR